MLSAGEKCGLILTANVYLFPQKSYTKGTSVACPTTGWSTTGVEIELMTLTRHLWILILATLTTHAFGQTWIELGDAPDGVPANQLTVGLGQLTQIRGTLDRPAGDHVDTYCIQITNPIAFFASTSAHLGGSLTATNELLANSRMWLWTQSQSEGMVDILLANDDDAFIPGDLASTIADPTQFSMLTGGSVDPTALGIVLVPGNTYLLSISTTPNDPEDANNVALSPIDIPPFTATSLYGPDPAAEAFDHWENEQSPDAGHYVIALQGVSYCVTPEPTALLSAAIGIALLSRFRRWFHLAS
jgi:hypothetical protein